MATPVKMLRYSKGMNMGLVLQWLKAPGDTVQEGEGLLHVLSEKADVQVEAPASGTLTQILVEAGAEVPVGTVLAWIGQPVSGPGQPDGISSPDTTTSRSPGTPQPAKASPLARRMAKEHDISLDGVHGSGPGGMITKEDIEQVLQARMAGAQQVEKSATIPDQAPGVEYAATIPAAQDDRIPLEGIRRVMAERMALSKRTAADVTTVVDVDMGAIRGLKEHIPITYTSAVVKAVALGLGQHPMLNSAIEVPGVAAGLSAGELPAGTMIRLHKDSHIGVAVDAPQGLMVVTIANAGQKSLRQVDEELRQLSEGTKTGKLRMAGMESPTFTVTNSGVLGSLMFTPIINPPQSATLGMGKVQDTAVVRGGQIVARPVMYLCLTYDHRIIEGAAAVRFLVEVKGILEDPARML